MSDTAYVVMSGAYSDLRVVAVFTDKDLVDAFMEMQGDRSDYDVEEWPLNPNPDIIRERRQSWYVEMSWDGDVRKVTKCGPLPSKYEPIVWNPFSETWWRFVVADTQERAIKSTNEQRTQAIANGTPRETTEYYEWAHKHQGAHDGIDP